MNRLISLFLVTSSASLTAVSGQENSAVPPELRPWLEAPQAWERDTAGPIVELGENGDFDDRHIFAPSVAWTRAEKGEKFHLWYSGSRGSVKDRVFRLGLATSSDGRSFAKAGENPIFSFGDPEERQSVLTPCLLRDSLGRPQKIGGEMILYFSATDFHDPAGRHTLHRTTSPDGVNWSKPSPSLLEGCYSPTLVKIGRLWQLWYTDVSGTPWIFRKAESTDGLKWRVHPDPVMILDQAWERTNLFYPHVIKPGANSPYLMWYGSYLAQNQGHTALGFAASLDGLKWYKHPQNPVFRSDPSRPWESHYVTSHSVAVLPNDDGSHDFRIWYASRKAPPFENKYFALNTAIWKSPGPFDPPPPALADLSWEELMPNVFSHPFGGDGDAFLKWQKQTRNLLSVMLGIPEDRAPLDAEKRGELIHDGVVIEKWIFTAEAGSKVPALLYRPENPMLQRLPSIVLTYGHGGSKSAWQYHYAGQLYARLGMACLAIDPIGEEERHLKGGMGTRAHDPHAVHRRADAAGRLIMGKFVFDTIRGIDFLLARDDIDSGRIGVAGNSLGGAVAGWMAALEPRLDTTIICGWAFDDISLRTKFCTSVPNQRMRELCTWPQFLQLMSPKRVLIMNGDADWVIDREDDQSAWDGMRRHFLDLPFVPGELELKFEEGGGHRPYFLHPHALHRIRRHLPTPAMPAPHLFSKSLISGGAYCDENSIPLEKLYGTDLHQRGATLFSPYPPIRPLTRVQLAVLKPDESGNPDFTLEGWLEAIEARP